MLCPLYSRELRKTAVEQCQVLSIHSHIVTYLVPDTGLNTEIQHEMQWTLASRGLHSRKKWVTSR